MAYLNLTDLADELADLRDKIADGETLDNDDAERLESLEAVEVELGDLHDYALNVDDTLIPDGDFEDYARQLAEDVCDLPDTSEWPLYCIDWAQAARDLAQDYTSVTYEGEDYLIRCC